MVQCPVIVETLKLTFTIIDLILLQDNHTQVMYMYHLQLLGLCVWCNTFVHMYIHSLLPVYSMSSLTMLHLRTLVIACVYIIYGNV